MLIAVLQKVVPANVELESGALGKAESRHHHFEVLQFGRECLLLTLKSGHRVCPTIICLQTCKGIKEGGKEGKKESERENKRERK